LSILLLVLEFVIHLSDHSFDALQGATSASFGCGEAFFPVTGGINPCNQLCPESLIQLMTDGAQLVALFQFAELICPIVRLLSRWSCSRNKAYRTTVGIFYITPYNRCVSSVFQIGVSKKQPRNVFMDTQTCH
jgi:hypothetical protein